MRRDVAARFDHILVDEYQDTNRLQASMLLALRPNGKGLTVVGDDAQAIYSFRAATVRNILDFPGHFTPRAEVVTLEQNYRSTQPILAAANAVIGLAEERFTKNLWSDRKSAERPLVGVRDETDQARYVVEKVLQSREAGLALKSQAVLFRASHHSGPLEVELTRRNIPFVKFGGLKFLEAAHIKDMLAMLRFAENPRDRVAGFRVIQLLPGIGPATPAKALDRVGGHTDPVAALEAEAAVGRGRALAGIRRSCSPGPFRRCGLAGRARSGSPLVRAASRSHPRGCADASGRSCISSCRSPRPIRAASDFSPNSRSIRRMPPATAPARRCSTRTISFSRPSIRRKGQEWKSVICFNAVDGCLPSDLATGKSAEIEEERRLLYVAMTRARDHLHVIVPQRFFVHGQRSNGDRHMYASRTRFIPSDLLEHFECCGWPAADGDAGLAEVSAGARRYSATRARQLGLRKLVAQK